MKSAESADGRTRGLVPDVLNKFTDEIKERYKPFLAEWDGTFD